MIFATILTTLGRNQYMVVTSLGAASLAYGLVPEDTLIMGETVGVIQCGDTFSVFRYGRRLRSIHAVTDEQAKTLAATDTGWQWQYLAARVGVEVGNITRLCELAEVLAVSGRQVTVARDSGQSVTLAADWVDGIKPGDVVVVDNELARVIGFACEKTMGYTSNLNYTLGAVLRDSFGAEIAASLPVEIIRNGFDAVSGISEVITPNGAGELEINGFLPDEITLKYSHGGTNYQYNCPVEIPTGAVAVSKAPERISLYSAGGSGRFEGELMLTLGIGSDTLTADSVFFAGVAQSPQAADFGEFSFAASNSGTARYDLNNGIRFNFEFRADGWVDIDGVKLNADIAGQGLGRGGRRLDSAMVCYSGSGGGNVGLSHDGEPWGVVNVSANIESVHANMALTLNPYVPEVLE